MSKLIKTGKRYTSEQELTSFFFRIIEKLNKDPLTGCWNWEGTTGNESGHKKIKLKGKVEQTHRIVYQLYKGIQLTPDQKVLHRPEVCRSKACCNPEHLKIGTAKDNMEDRRVEGTINCPRKRLGKEVREAAQLLLEAGKGPSEVAKLLKLNRVTVSNMKKRLEIKNVKEE